jgi:hypothetical protein
MGEELGQSFCYFVRVSGTKIIQLISKECQIVRFQVLTAASMKVTAFCDTAPFSLAEVDFSEA